MDVAGRSQERVGVGQDGCIGRLMRDKGPHLLRVLGDQLQRINCTAAACEEVDWATAYGVDDPMDVIAVLLDGVLSGFICPLAPIAPTRVVRDDGAVGEVAGQCRESASSHRRADQQQDRV